jgi:2',3'-cyclic-nucleotide 2'-phosphodiesterase (5'-nucleotidase family)
MGNMRACVGVFCGLVASACGGGWLSAFNECNPDRGDALGRTTVELDVRKVAVRSSEMPVGNLVVDAMFDAATAACVPGDSSRPCPVAALENAGGIRNTTACGERDTIPIGTLFNSDVGDMLPFATNQLVVVDVTGEELWLMLEHSSALLGQVGEAGAAGFFLQVHGVAFEVNCAGTSQGLSSSGDRILNRGGRVDPTRVFVNGVQLSLTATYPVLMNSFVAGAKDGFLALAQRNADDSVIKGGDGKVLTKPSTFVLLDGAKVSEAAALQRYVKTRTVVAPRVEGRIRILASCVPTQ